MPSIDATLTAGFPSSGSAFTPTRSSSDSNLVADDAIGFLGTPAADVALEESELSPDERFKRAHERAKEVDFSPLLSQFMPDFPPPASTGEMPEYIDSPVPDPVAELVPMKKPNPVVLQKASREAFQSNPDSFITGTVYDKTA